MATEKQILTADAGDLPQIDFDQQQREMTQAVGQEKDPARRAVLQRDLAHVSGVNELLQMGGSSAPAAKGGSSEVDELLALPAIADTSDPKGNMDPRDIRQTQGYQDQLPPSWLARARQSMAAVPPARAALELTQPGVANAVARRAVPTIAGSVGDVVDFAGNTVPKLMGFRGLQGHTGAPTSEDVSGALSRIGWQDPSAQHPIASQFGSALGAVTPLGPLTDATVVRPLINKFTKAGELAEEAQAGVSSAARAGQQRIVEQNPMPGPMADPALPTPVRPQYPGPRADEPIPVSPIATKPVARTAPATPSSRLEAHIAENDARLGAEKQAAYERYRAATPPVGIDLQDFKNDLTTRIARAGTDEEATALRKVLNRVNTIEAESDTQFESLDKLRRQMGKQAAYGETPSGYEAIGKTQARDLNKALGERMKAEHPAYAEYTKKYRDLAQESAPSGSAFLKQAGADEGSANLVKNALASPKNVDQTIAAIGKDGVTKLDALALQHVQSILGRKSGQALEDAITDLGPSLERLPDARAEAQRILKRDQLELANQGTVDNILKMHGERVKQGAASYGAEVKGAKDVADTANKAALAKHANEAEGAARGFSANVKASQAAQETARSYTPMLNNLQQDVSPARRVDVLRSMTEKMWKDGLISDAEHAGFGAQIERASNAADKQKALQTLSKYVAYTLTGNYMISFGGPHLISYLQK